MAIRTAVSRFVIGAEQSRVTATGNALALTSGMLSVIVALIVFGLILYLINTYVPMDPKIQAVLNAVIVIALIVWLCQTFGLFGSLNAPLRVR